MRAVLALVAIAVLAGALAQQDAAAPPIERQEGVAKVQCTRRLNQYGLYLHRHCVGSGEDGRLSTMLSNMYQRCAFASSTHVTRGVLADTAKRAVDIVGQCAAIVPREKVVG
jgi:hypothetical protein